MADNDQVLLVEDNPVNQSVIEAMLRSLGLAVCTAEDGLEAVERVSQQRFAAVLMDCRLPHLDGYEATRRIRQLPNGARLPIIALTANALQGDRERCMAAGMDDYLSKPCAALNCSACCSAGYPVRQPRLAINAKVRQS